MGTAALFTSGAVHQRRYFFGSGSAATFFRHQRQAQRRWFLVKKAAALQRFSAPALYFKQMIIFRFC